MSVPLSLPTLEPFGNKKTNDLLASAQIQLKPYAVIIELQNSNNAKIID